MEVIGDMEDPPPALAEEYRLAASDILSGMSD
jgi:hypothetical protein